MNTLMARKAEISPLVEVIELKWLLIGEGLHLHVEHMLSDPEYARRALDQAAASASPSLRAAAARVRARLGLSAD
jgi:hypothetical protein